MQFIFAFVASLVSVIMMFIIAKLVGYRQISELSMYDYINSITLGSIAADLAISTDFEKALACFIAMIVYGAATLIFSYLAMRSKNARSVLVGSPIVLMEKGKLYKNSFKKAKLDMDEFLSMCRAAGYFDPSKLDTVLLEPSGKISIIPKSANRPLTPEDMNLPTQRERLCPNIIMDGEICISNLKDSGHDEVWLKNSLKALGVNSAKEAFLGIIDSNNELQIFKMQNKDKINPL